MSELQIRKTYFDRTEPRDDYLSHPSGIVTVYAVVRCSQARDGNEYWMILSCGRQPLSNEWRGSNRPRTGLVATFRTE